MAGLSAKTADDRSDRVVTKQLLDILMDCHKYCSREAEAQRKSIMTALTFDSGNQADQATMLAQDTRRKLSDFIKSVAPELVSFLKRKYSSKVVNTASEITRTDVSNVVGMPASRLLPSILVQISHCLTMIVTEGIRLPEIWSIMSSGLQYI